MSIKIKESDSDFIKATVYFSRLQSSGRRTYNSIEVKLADNYDPTYINVPATGDMSIEDAKEFVKAVEVAIMVANGELEI